MVLCCSAKIFLTNFAKKWYASTTKTILNIYRLASITVTKFFFVFLRRAKEWKYILVAYTCKILLCTIKAGHIVIQALIRFVLTDLVF